MEQGDGEVVIEDCEITNGAFVGAWIDGPNLSVSGTDFSNFAYGIYLPGDPAAAAGRRTCRDACAANHASRVFLAGEELARHEGGFGPFAVELTERFDAGSSGEHSIVIQVDNRREPDRIPAMRSDWWNFGGLTRSVDLVWTPRTFLADGWLTMSPDGRVIGGHRVDGDDTEPVRLTLPGLLDTTVESTFELDLAGTPGLNQAVTWQMRGGDANAPHVLIFGGLPGEQSFPNVSAKILIASPIDALPSILADGFGFNTLGFAVARDSSPLLGFIDEYVAETKASGIVQRILDDTGLSARGIAVADAP